MDPFIASVATDLIARTEARLLQTEFSPQDSPALNHVGKRTAKALLRNEITDTMETYADMAPAALVGLVQKTPRCSKSPQRTSRPGSTAPTSRWRGGATSRASSP